MAAFREARRRRLDTVDGVRLWFKRQIRWLKRRCTLNVSLVILAVMIFASIVIFWIMPSYSGLRQSDDQTKLRPTTMDHISRIFKAKYDHSRQWATAHKDGSMADRISKREARIKKGSSEPITYGWLVMPVLLLAGILLILAVSWLTRAIQWCLDGHFTKALKRFIGSSKTFFRSFRLDRRGWNGDFDAQRRALIEDLEAQRLRVTPEGLFITPDGQVDGSVAFLNAGVESWRNNAHVVIHEPTRAWLNANINWQPGRAPAPQIRYSPERSAPIQMNTASETEPLLPSPSNTAASSDTCVSSPENFPHTDQPGYGTRIQRIIASFMNPVWHSSSPTLHEDYSAATDNTPVHSHPRTRREDSGSDISSNSVIFNTNPGTSDATIPEGLEGTTIPSRHGRREPFSDYDYTTDYSSLNRANMPLIKGSEIIGRASPGMIVFKNMIEEDFSDNRLLEIEEGRIFWLSC